MFGVQSQPDTRGHTDNFPFDLVWSSEDFDQLFSHSPGVAGLRELRQADDELVAAQPRYRVAVARRGEQPRGRLFQQLVAAVMPKVVIYGFETIEIYEKDRHAVVAAASKGDRLQ